MRLLADESVDIAIVRALRRAGHDVIAIAETQPGISDEEVTRLAADDARVLLTEDRDFGRIVYAGHRNTPGVIYMRYPIAVRDRFSAEIVRLGEQQQDRLRGAFVVAQPGRTRVSNLEPE